ncbi:MAG: phosphoadenylyl-sulfate reductase [Candidatus Firestonebacteria bacterium]
MKLLKEEIEKYSKELENKSPEDVLKWSFDTFKDKVALASSFGAEDVVLTDMMVKINPSARIFTLDTGRLPQETYEVFEKTREKYKVNIEVYCPDTASLEKMTEEYGPDLFYKSIENRKLCCTKRKIEPLNRSLSKLDAWICGLRREQSVTRTKVEKVELDVSHNNMAKINPLADWTEKQVWDYIKANDVPYNALHNKNYPSIGCAPCTRAVKPGEDVRAGRWWWESPEQKECGLHGKK